MRCAGRALAGPVPAVPGLEHFSSRSCRARRAGRGQPLRRARRRDQPAAPVRARTARSAASHRSRRVRPRARWRPGRRRRGADRRRPGIGKSTRCCRPSPTWFDECVGWQPASTIRGIPSARAASSTSWRGVRRAGRLRAQRLQLPQSSVQMLAEINLERTLATPWRRRARVVAVIDSDPDRGAAPQYRPGSVAQVRECAAQLNGFDVAERHQPDPGRVRHLGRHACPTACSSTSSRVRADHPGGTRPLLVAVQFPTLVDSSVSWTPTRAACRWA